MVALIVAAAAAADICCLVCLSVGIAELVGSPYLYISISPRWMAIRFFFFF